VPKGRLLGVAGQIALELPEVSLKYSNLNLQLSTQEWGRIRKELPSNPVLERTIRDAIQKKVEEEVRSQEALLLSPIVDSSRFRSETDHRLKFARIKLRERDSRNYDHLSRLDSEVSLRTAIAAPIVAVVAGALHLVLPAWDQHLPRMMILFAGALVPGCMLISSAERISREARDIVHESLGGESIGDGLAYQEDLIALR
jgi:hypothetical protein